MPVTFSRALSFLFVSALTSSTPRAVSGQADIRGPPVAKERVAFKIGNLGDNLRLQCPIVGYPAPFFEWKKDGHPIDDITWMRYRKNKNVLKVRNANHDDTGIYTCKGINGFGSSEARIEVIIVDQSAYPPQLASSGALLSVAPPVFTAGTRQAKRHLRKEVGQSFRVSCEALGSPSPTLQWLKDGHPIRESVVPSQPPAGGAVLSASSGRSAVEFQVLGTADSGVYTCRAGNDVGVRDLNFTLTVNSDDDNGMGHGGMKLHAVVTEAGPENGTDVRAGDTAVMRCRVKSIEQPHIKWLRKLHTSSSSSSVGQSSNSNPAIAEPFTSNHRGDVLSIYSGNVNSGNEKYKVMHSAPDVRVGEGEYVNRLVIPSAAASDSGMYICFVTNSGFGPLTYKSAYLKVVPIPAGTADVSSTGSSRESALVDNLILICVIGVLGAVFIVSVVVVVCVLRKSGIRSAKNNGHSKMDSGSGMVGSGSSMTDDATERPFLMAPPSSSSAAAHSTLSLPPLPPPSSLMEPAVANGSSGGMGMGQWSRTVYPATTSFGSHFRYKPAPPPPRQQSSSYYETPSVNQYEVPYSHMLQMSNSNHGSGSTNSSSKSSSGPNRSSANQQQQHYQVFHLQQQQQQPHPHFGSQQHLVRYAMQPAPSPAAVTQTTVLPNHHPQSAVFSSASAGHILDLVQSNRVDTQQQQPHNKQSLQYFQYLRGYDI